MVAILASPLFGGVGYGPGMDMASQAVTQVIGVAVVCAWSAVATLVIIAIVRRLTGLRASDDMIDDGLDLASHGERAYNP